MMYIKYVYQYDSNDLRWLVSDLVKKIETEPIKSLITFSIYKLQLSLLIVDDYGWSMKHLMIFKYKNTKYIHSIPNHQCRNCFIWTK